MRSACAVAMLCIISLLFAAPAVAQSMVIGKCQIVFGAPVKCPQSDFSGRDLRGQLFAMADLSGAIFDWADLEDLDFWKADLHGSLLRDADMAHVFLTGADLRGANLQNADLSYAFLFRAKTVGANFAGANLMGARWITGELCGPGSIGVCKPLPVSEAFAPRPLTWHLLPRACREYWLKSVANSKAGQADHPVLPPGCGDPHSAASKPR